MIGTAHTPEWTTRGNWQALADGLWFGTLDPQDYPLVADLVQDGVDLTPDIETTVAVLRNANRILAVAPIHRVTFIGQMDVLPELRGQGIGSLMADCLLQAFTPGSTIYFESTHPAIDRIAEKVGAGLHTGKLYQKDF